MCRCSQCCSCTCSRQLAPNRFEVKLRRQLKSGVDGLQDSLCHTPYTRNRMRKLSYRLETTISLPVKILHKCPSPLTVAPVASGCCLGTGFQEVQTVCRLCGSFTSRSPHGHKFYFEYSDTSWELTRNKLLGSRFQPREVWTIQRYDFPFTARRSRTRNRTD